MIPFSFLPRRGRWTLSTELVIEFAPTLCPGKFNFTNNFLLSDSLSKASPAELARKRLSRLDNLRK